MKPTKQLSIVASILLTCLISSSAFALLEVRGNFGGASINPKDFNGYLKSQNVKEAYIMGEIGLDAILEIPTTGLGLGARYQYSGMKLDANISPASAADMEYHIERYMILGRYLVTAGPVEVGPILTVGLNHKPSLRIKSSSGTIAQYDTADTKSFNAGLEAGFKIAFLKFGGETGYQYYVIENFKGPNGTLPVKIDLSGWYLMGHLGISI